MVAVVTLLVVLTLSLLITRIATLALTHTGLSKQAARFQARSAFTGVGFTTAESEKVVNHPVRRRVLLLLMLLGNAGIVTAVSSLILTMLRLGTERSPARDVVVLVTGLVALWAIASSQWVEQRLSRVIDKALRRYTRLDVRDYASLLHLTGEYRVAELEVEPEDWIAGKELANLALPDEGIMVLGIVRDDGNFLGAPRGATAVRAGDTLLLYGRTAAVERIDERREGALGDWGHQEAVREQRQIQEREERRDRTADSAGKTS